MAMKRGKTTKGAEPGRARMDMNWYYRAVHEYFQREDWPRLSGRGFMVWTALWAKSVPTMGISGASHEVLRKMTKARSKATIKSAVEELVEKGYIARIVTREYRPQYAWTYRMLRRPGARHASAMLRAEDLLVKGVTQSEQGGEANE